MASKDIFDTLVHRRVLTRSPGRERTVLCSWPHGSSPSRPVDNARTMGL
jgi:hypothetical protein